MTCACLWCCICLHACQYQVPAASYVMAPALADWRRAEQSGAGRRKCRSLAPTPNLHPPILLLLLPLPLPHSAQHRDRHPRPARLHFTTHVSATAASLLPARCLPLRQQRPRRTGSVTHRLPASHPIGDIACPACVCLHTSARIALIATHTDL